MNSLTRYLDNPFANEDLALDDLLAFTTDHLGRLRSRNADGQNDTLVGPLESALAGLTAAMGQDGTRLGQRKARKQVKRHFRYKVLPPGLKRVEGCIVAYPEGADEVLKKAFPHGRGLFHRCADDLLRLGLRHPGRPALLAEYMPGVFAASSCCRLGGSDGLGKPDSPRSPRNAST